ncbi:conserved hypothetical protein, partial [Ixodes scapularis]
LALAETYAECTPSKLKIGGRHPYPVVETSSLSSVAPPAVWYDLCIPKEVVDRGQLSALQLEVVMYASQQHQVVLTNGSRAGFLIGDGAGVGKGRTIAGIIYENFLRGRRKAIWVSVSTDLKVDSERDLSDIGAAEKIKVHSLKEFKYAKIPPEVNGVMFSTYSSLIGESQGSGVFDTRLAQLLHWCGSDFDGVIVFDECHKAKNLCPVGSSKPTKTGATVLELQNRLPKSRVVYASATGASEPKNMAYMTRLGIWGEGTSFRRFSDFVSAMEKRGVGAMELVAVDMKLQGMYMARQLSFSGVSFRIEDIHLGKEFIAMYNESVELWVNARAMFQEAAQLMRDDAQLKKVTWNQFWASHQRFFKYLCIASKVPHVVTLTRQAIEDGKRMTSSLFVTTWTLSVGAAQEGPSVVENLPFRETMVASSFLISFHNSDKSICRLFLAVLKGVAFTNDTLESRPLVLGKRFCVDALVPARQAQQTLKRYREALSDDNSEVEMKSEPESDFEPSVSSSPAKDSEGSLVIELDSEDDLKPLGNGLDSVAGYPQANCPSRLLCKVLRVECGNAVLDLWVPPRSLDNLNSSIKLGGKSSKLKAKNRRHRKIPMRDGANLTEDEKKAAAMKQTLLERLERLGEKLPPNTLDQLIDELGGPNCVAEMTGRRGRVVSTAKGTVHYEPRSEVDVPLKTLNLTEKQRFMDGEKLIAIISEAASLGISLHSDRRAKNQARRVHLTLELPWSADRAVQQFGRTHRSNQVNAPEYVFLISDLAGERRFASIVAKRLESLGALTHGDRRAGESRDLSRFNIDNRYGNEALQTMMSDLMEVETSPLIPPPKDWEGDFFADCRKALVGVGLVNENELTKMQILDKDYTNMSQFLNRILGIPVELQNAMFKYFTDTLDAIVSEAKRAGHYDLGILDLGTSGDNVRREEGRTFVRSHATGTAKTELHTVGVERGLAFDAKS